MTIKLTPTQKKRILNGDDIYGIMREILMRDNKIDRNKEHLWLVCLSSTNMLMMIELISLGSVHATIVEPMAVFSFALQKHAAKLILVHNHPGGTLQPSAADLDITERMFAISLFIRVPIIDHLIISPKGFYSFDEHGLMDKMLQEKKYDLTFAEQDKLQKEMGRIALEKEVAEKERNIAEAKLKTAEKDKAEAVKAAQHERSIEMAKKLLSEGLPIATIVKVSGLKKKEVEALIA